MKTAALFALSALSSLVAAAPVKRDIVYITYTKEYVETVATTTTIYVDPSEYSALAAQPTGGQFYETPAYEPTPTPAEPSSYVAPVASSPASVYTPPPAPTTTETPISVYTPPPVPTTTETPAPVYTPATSAAPAETPIVSAQSSSGSGSGSGSSGETYTGELTFYTPGLGACGWTSSDGDAIVALAHGMMGEQSNGNPWCGKSITIEYNGVTQTGKIVDKCMGCDGADIDVSPSLFTAFAAESEGRLYGVKWWVNE